MPVRGVMQFDPPPRMPGGPGGENTDSGTPRYQGLWRFSVIATSLVAILPLLIMTLINYIHDQEAYRTESLLAVNRVLSANRRSLDLALEERRGALSLIISEKSHEELSSNVTLAVTLKNLERAFGGFVDLGLIDSNGNQRFYSGPYELEGRNYQGQDWFLEVILRGIYVSDVFMGFRNFPHLVIAVKGDKENGGFYILRATIDMGLMNNRLYGVELDRQTDSFIINHDAVLQTSSAFYGNVLEKAAIEVPPPLRNSEVVDQYTEDGSWVTFGYAYIEKTPFILVVIRRQANAIRSWLTNRSVMIWVLGASIVAILAVVLYGSNRMVRGLREADRRRAKAVHDLEYNNKLATIGRMAASVAHEINNPLAIINEDAGLLQDMAMFAADYPMKEKTLGLVASIHKSVERCSNVTHRLLGFAKRMDMRKEPIALDRLLIEVVGFQRTEALHRNIDIEYHFPENVSPIESDRGKLQQVFLNILSNAFAAVDDNGKIVIQITQIDNANLAAVISDDGPGIPEDMINHIFEPFYSTKGEFGTGLGLSITHDIVSKLGGTIDVQSTTGKGSSFIVTLPFKVPDIRGES